MRTFPLRQVDETVDNEKSPPIALGDEIDINDEDSGSMDHDAVDMHKLGVKQETKVSSTTY